MADEEEAPTNAALVATETALMAFSDSEVNSIIKCFESCSALKENEELKRKADNRREELITALANLSNHKRAIGVLEKQIAHFQDNESMFTDDLNALKRGIAFRDELLTGQSKQLAEANNKTENVKITIDALAHASEGMNKIWEAQVIDKAKSGLGYKYVPPP